MRVIMNGWNRLFVVVAICWAIVAPFLMMSEANGPVEQIFKMCSDTAYRRYGSSDSPRLDWDRYQAETKKCLDSFTRDFTSLPKVLLALVGAREDSTLSLQAWGFILIPLCLLWVIGRVIGGIVRWVAV